jgi:uncharacterized membrane protein
MNTLKSTNNRIQSIDLVRGIAMIIMALDHSRDFIHYGASIDQNPLDFATTTPFLFVTRWITHFCAPVFVFLSGTGIFLYGTKGKTKKQVGFFLLTRGLWLMFIEIVLIQPIWDFNLSQVFLQVIWAIGLSMVVLSALQFLSYKLLLAVGLLIILGHNLLDPISVEQPFWSSVGWSIVHQSHIYPINDHFMFTITYPFLPWLGLMITGYALGKLYLPSVNPQYRRKFLLYSGFTLIGFFIIIRFSNFYGDMHPWATQKTTFFTILDFVKTTKYPPSLLYILMTMGPALILLSFVENISNGITKKITVFGKVPFFYYVLHIALIHIIAWILFFGAGHGWKDLDFTHFRDGSLPFGNGHPLWVVYAVWAAVIIILYFPCRWYSRYKSSHRQWWLSYI